MSSARLTLHVKDDRGWPSPCRADFHLPGGSVERRWSGGGEIEAEVPPGRLAVVVRRGFDHDAVCVELDVPPGGQLTRGLVLRRRFNARALGWYAGESHMHVLHGRSDPPRTIADGAGMAAGDGLDYLQLADAWDASFAWLPVEELERQCRAASTPEVAIGWNLEAPKAYMSADDGGESGNLHCFGHGWTAGLKDHSRGREFFHSGPNFRVIQEVQRQGGIVGCAHPVRCWFNKGNFVSNWASELPFDFVAGAPYAAVDILNDAPLLFFESQRFWYTLLNLGYKVAGTGNSDGALGANRGLCRFRTYTKIDGAFTWAKLAGGIRAGCCVASSVPFALFAVDGQPPGAEFPADGKPRPATLKAWSAPLPGETLTAVQLVRNGEVIRAWDLRAEHAREWETSFELRDSEFAWYCVCVLSGCRDRESLAMWGPQIQELAVANPVYFLPAGFARPQPEAARVTLSVTDALTGGALAASVRVLDAAGGSARAEVPASGQCILTVPATASLQLSAPGYELAERNLYVDCPALFNYCRDIGTVWPSFFSPETYQELRLRLQHLKLAVALKRSPH